MRLAAGLFAGAMSASALAADAPVLTPSDVIARHEALDGKVVRVRGWLLNECYNLSCAINMSRQPDSDRLSIGGSRAFDASLQVARAVGKEILVEGRVKRGCFDHPKGDPGYNPDVITICTDRADQLADPGLIKVFSSQDK